MSCLPRLTALQKYVSELLSWSTEVRRQLLQGDLQGAMIAFTGPFLVAANSHGAQTGNPGFRNKTVVDVERLFPLPLPVECGLLVSIQRVVGADEAELRVQPSDKRGVVDAVAVIPLRVRIEVADDDAGALAQEVVVGIQSAHDGRRVRGLPLGPDAEEMKRVRSQDKERKDGMWWIASDRDGCKVKGKVRDDSNTLDGTVAAPEALTVLRGWLAAFLQNYEIRREGLKQRRARAQLASMAVPRNESHGFIVENGV
jgi:hypothetical protein